MENRQKLIDDLHKCFLADLLESIKPFKNVEDLIYIAKNLREYLVNIYNIRPESDLFEAYDFDETEFIRTTFLEKYRDKMIPFIKTSLRFYFAKDEFNQLQLFQKLKINEPALNYDEYEIYSAKLNYILTVWLDRLYLMPPNFEQVTELPTIPQETEQKTKYSEYTRSRQLLMFYYLTQSAGINRNTVSFRNLAQFAHYLFNYPNDNIDNSEVYKQLKKAPLIKADAYLKKDLEFVKKQFEAIEYSQAVTLIDKEIKSIKG